MRPHRLAALAAAALVGACSSGEAFVDLPIDNRMAKPEPLARSGGVTVCYTDQTPRAEIEALAHEACASYGLEARFIKDARYQCRLTVPHRAQFQCIDPEMTTAKGGYVNPLNEVQVREWEKRTGKTRRTNLGQRVLTPADGLPASPAPSPSADAPAPAPVLESIPGPAPAVPAAKPLPAGPSAADLNPPRPVPPVPHAAAPAAPAPQPLPDDSGFRLPVGTWGDAFQE